MNKKLFTQAIITEADLDIEYGQAIKDWWFITSEHHYRLTYRGYKTLLPVTPSFPFLMKTAYINNKQRLMLGKLNCAYFLNDSSSKKVVYIFSTKIATIIGLYGNIDRYLETLE